MGETYIDEWFIEMPRWISFVAGILESQIREATTTTTQKKYKKVTLFIDYFSFPIT